MKKDRFEKMLGKSIAANLPNLARDINLQVYKTKCVTNMINLLKSMPRCIFPFFLKRNDLGMTFF